MENDLILQMKGRADFLRDQGEVKTPELLYLAADELSKARASRYSRDLAGAKYESDLANKLREAAGLLSYNDGNLKSLLSEAYHRLDSRVSRIHKKSDGYLMLTASGACRFMTFKEMILYRLFGYAPVHLN